MIKNFPEHEDLSFNFIKEKFSLINEEAAKKFCLYLKENDVSKFPLYDSEKGIRKIGKERLTHQVAILDTPNQIFFLKRGHFDYRLMEIEKFFTLKMKPYSQIYKFAFITDEVETQSRGAINFLDQKLNWYLIQISKSEKTTDVDAKIAAFVNDIDNLYSREWDTIYVISSDNQLINFFLNTYKSTPETNLFFITAPDEDYLKFKAELRKFENNDVDLNIYYRT